MIRTYNFQLNATGDITPKTAVFGGYVGEHNATTLHFAPENSLRTALNQKAQNHPIYYRFEVSDAQNRLFHLERAVLNENIVPKLALSNALTQTAGMLTVTVIFEITEGTTPITLCSFPVHLTLEEAVHGTPDTPQVAEALSGIVEQAATKLAQMEDCLQEAQTAASQCTDATEQTLSAATDAANSASSAAGTVSTVTAYAQTIQRQSATATNAAQMAARAASSAAASETAAAASAQAAQLSAADCRTQIESVQTSLNAKADQSVLNGVVLPALNTMGERLDAHTQSSGNSFEYLYHVAEWVEAIEQRVTDLETSATQNSGPAYSNLYNIGGCGMDRNYTIPFTNTQKDLYIMISLEPGIQGTVPDMDVKIGSYTIMTVDLHENTEYLLRFKYLGYSKWDHSCRVLSGQGSEADVSCNSMDNIDPFRQITLAFTDLLPHGINMYVFGLS